MIHNEEIMLRALLHFWKTLELFLALITAPQIRKTYINALNVIRDLRCCKQTVYSIRFMKAHFSFFSPGQWEAL